MAENKQIGGVQNILRSGGVILVSLLVSSPTLAAKQAPSSLDCVITPSEIVDLSSAVPGVIDSVEVDRSDWVEPGQILARMDSGVEKAQLKIAAARAAMDKEIEIQATKNAFDSRNRKRVEVLHHKQAVSFREVDKAKLEVNISALKHLHARELLKLRQLEMQKAEAVLEQKIIRSRVKGVVVQRFKTPGEYVEKQAIMRVARLDPLHVEVIAPMQLFGSIKVGMQAAVMPESFSTEPRSATVSIVDPMGDAASGTFGIRLTLPNSDNKLPAGLKCNVRFLDAARENPGVKDRVVKR